MSHAHRNLQTARATLNGLLDAIGVATPRLTRDLDALTAHLETLDPATMAPAHRAPTECAHCGGERVVDVSDPTAGTPKMETCGGCAGTGLAVAQCELCLSHIDVACSVHHAGLNFCTGCAAVELAASDAEIARLVRENAGLREMVSQGIVDLTATANGCGHA